MSKNFIQTIGLMATASTILLVTTIMLVLELVLVESFTKIIWVWQLLNLFILSGGIYAVWTTTTTLKEKQFIDYLDFHLLGLGSILLGTTTLLGKTFSYFNETVFIGLALIVGIACFELSVFYSNFKVTKPHKQKIKSLKTIQPQSLINSILRGKTNA